MLLNQFFQNILGLKKYGKLTNFIALSIDQNSLRSPIIKVNTLLIAFNGIAAHVETQCELVFVLILCHIPKRIIISFKRAPPFALFSDWSNILPCSFH